MKIRNDDRTANWIKQNSLMWEQRRNQASIVPSPAELPEQPGVTGTGFPSLTGELAPDQPKLPGLPPQQAGQQPFHTQAYSQDYSFSPEILGQTQAYLKTGDPYRKTGDPRGSVGEVIQRRMDMGKLDVGNDQYLDLLNADPSDVWAGRALQLVKQNGDRNREQEAGQTLLDATRSVQLYERISGQGTAPQDMLNAVADAQALVDSKGIVEPLRSGPPDPPTNESQSPYYNGSFHSASDLKPSDIPTTVGELGIIGGKALALIMANNVEFRIDQDDNIIPYKNVNGEELDLVGAQRTEMLHAKRMMDDSYKLNLETSISNATTANAMLIQENAQKFSNDQADIQRRFDANQADLTRALTSGTLEESIRANRASEGLARERNMLEKRQFAANMMYQIASNPSALFFLRQSGIVDQLSELMGIDFKVFGGPTDGPTNPIGAWNMQSWSQLTPEQQKVALYSMQAQTGLSTAEIMRQIEKGAPGGTGRVIRGISG